MPASKLPSPVLRLMQPRPPSESYDISPWIGKQYPTNPPEGLREYCDFTITMPESYKALLPDPKMAIPQFVEVSLPTQSPRLETYPIASQNFCNSLPSLDVDCLRRRTIPSREFIVEAINHSRQALLDGMQSFIDPHFFQDRVPLPFWVLSFWRHMWFALDAQVTWKECNIWLNNQNDNSAREPTIMMCRARMNKLGWNEPIVLNRKCASSLILAELLSNNHISPSLFDMLMINTSQRLGDDLAASELYRVEASSARLMREIEGAWKAQNMLRAPNLQHLTQHMTALKKTMYFGLPAREEGNYIIFSIDFKAQTISHANALGREYEPTRVIKLIQWWLTRSFLKPFKQLNGIIEQGQQRDATSSAIVAVNMVEYAVLGAPLWNNSRAVHERLIWFNRLALAIPSSCIS